MPDTCSKLPEVFSSSSAPGSTAEVAAVSGAAVATMRLFATATASQGLARQQLRTQNSLFTQIRPRHRYTHRRLQL